MSPEVIANDSEMLFEHSDLRLPHAAIDAESVDEDDWLSGSTDFIEES